MAQDQSPLEGAEVSERSSVAVVNRDLCSETIAAIVDNSVGDVEKLISDGALNVRFEYTFDFWLKESRYGSREAKPAARQQEWTPLILAASLGQDDIVHLLLRSHADVHHTTSDAETALHHAALRGHARIASALLAKHAVVDARNSDDVTPLMYACWEGHLECVRVLVSHGANVTLSDSLDWTPLFFAVCEHQSEIVRLLLQTPGIPRSDRRRMLNAQSHEKKATPLRESIYLRVKECTKELLADPDVDVTIADHKGDTPMSVSAAVGDFPTLLQIFQMPIYSITDLLESSPRLATPRELKRVEKVLLDEFTRLEPWESNLPCVMQWAVVNGSLPLAQKCLDTLPSLIDYSGPMRATWLHIASRFDYGELARKLITYGVDVYAITERGMTALHLACVGGHSVTVKYLLEHLTSQAGKQAPGPGAATPRECDAARLIKFIIADDELGESAISLSAKAKGRGTSDILWAEIEAFASNKENLKRFSHADLERLMELAAQFEEPGSERILRVLLHLLHPKTVEKETEVDTSSWTTLHWAVQSARPELVWLLLSNGAHLKKKEISQAVQILESRTHNGSQSEADSVISHLLRSPPRVSAHAAIEDDFHQPEKPIPRAESKHFIENNTGIIVDFMDEAGFVMKRRTMGEIIYDKGPELIMSHVDKHDFSSLTQLKQYLKDPTQRSSSIDLESPNELGFRSAKTKATIDQKTVADRPAMSRREQQLERNESTTPRQHLTEKESRDFRWIHTPVHNMRLAEDLITRIGVDSRKTKEEHEYLMKLLRLGLVESPAGGGKRYIRPQLLVTAPMNKTGRTTPGETLNMTVPAGEDEESLAAALYMPFLTVSEIGGMGSKSDGIEVSSKAATSTTESKENRLALNVHERMTLDQYYYSIVADTTVRDREQVLSRYLEWRDSGNYLMTHSRKGEKEVGTSSELSRKVSVFSVDQLWLWIVDDATIVTASTCDFQSFVDLVLEDLVFSESRGRHPSPRTAPEMMETILRVITGPQMHSVSVEGNHNLKQPLEIFRDTIRLVAEEETKMTRAFIEEVVGASTGADPLPRRDLGLEFQLLYEIKDIQNELDILLALTKAQESVCSSSYLAALENLAPSRRALRTEIQAVQREAQRTRESINTLLDIRQKHTGNQDAEFGRQQAYTTMVFTIVTIVFLPLSFLTSPFALNIAVFPESPYPNQWIFPILFGCSTAFSIPATVVALNVNELVMKPYYRWRLSSRPKRDPWEGRHRRKETKDSDKADNLPVESVPRGGGILSIATALQRMSPSGGSFVARRLRNKKLEGSEGRDWDTSVC